MEINGGFSCERTSSIKAWETAKNSKNLYSKINQKDPSNRWRIDQQVGIVKIRG